MRAFVVTVPAAEVDLASDVLWQLGVRAIEERAGDDRPIVELWTAVGDDGAAHRTSRGGAGGAVAVARWSRSWTAAADTWREFAGPMWVDDGLVVVPAWQDHDVRRRRRADPDRTGRCVRARRPPDDAAVVAGGSTADLGDGSRRARRRLRNRRDRRDGGAARRRLGPSGRCRVAPRSRRRATMPSATASPITSMSTPHRRATSTGRSTWWWPTSSRRR